MTAPGISNLRLLSGPEFSPTSRLLASIHEVVDIAVQMKDNGTHEMLVTAPVGARWLSHVKARRVIWVRSEGVVTEWMVNRKSDSAGGTEVVIRCDPLHCILADYGVMEFVGTAGGMPFANLGGFNGTVENFLETYAIAALEDRGVDWIVLGTIDFTTEQFTLAFDTLNIQELVARLAKDAHGVWDLVRNEATSKYEITVLERFAASAPTYWSTEGVGLLELVRELDRGDLWTAIRPIGELPDQDEERANIGQAAHPVVAVTNDTITLGKHLYEDDATIGPINEDGQFAPVMVESTITAYPGRYLEAPDGTFHAITTTVAPRTVVVVTGGGASFAVGDDAVFVANSSGTLLTELASPSGIATEEFGFCQGKVQLPYGGHRNRVVNPAWRTWDASAPPVALGAFVQGVHSSATAIVIDGMASHAGLVISVGDVFHVTGTGVRSLNTVTTAVTIAAGGTATIPIATARSLTDNIPCLVHVQASRGPSYWDRVSATLNMATPYRSPRVSQATISCLAAGAHAGDATNGAYVSLDGVATNTVIRPGWYVASSAGTPRWVLSSSTVSTDGIARVAVLEPIALADNENVTIGVPEIGEGSGYVAGQFASLDQTTYPTLSQDVFVRYIPGISNKLWASVDLVARANTVAQGWTVSANFPRLSICDSGGSEITGLSADTWTPAAVGEHFSQVLRVAHEVEVSTALKVRFRWHGPTTIGTNAGNPWLWVRMLQLHMGVSESLAFVDGSEASKLFYDGQVVLDAHKQWPALYRATNLEMAAHFGVSPDSRALQLGSAIRIRSTSLGVSTLLYVVGMQFNPLDPHVKVLTLGVAPKYITDQFGRIVPKRQRVHIKVDIDAGGQVDKTVLADALPPAAVPTTIRFEGDPGSITNGSLPPTPYEPPT